MVQLTKTSLHLGARHAEVVQSAIKHWAESSTISEDQASLLVDTIVVKGFDWEKFAKYTLRLAILCLVVAVTSVVFEKSFLRFYRRLVALPPWLRGSTTDLIGVGVHIFAHQRSQRLPKQKYGNEAVHGVGALLLALAAFQLLEQLEDSFKHSTQAVERAASESKVEEQDDERSQKRKKREAKERKQLKRNMVQCVALGLAAVYGAVGILSTSNFIWSCSMMVLGYCCGGMADYA